MTKIDVLKATIYNLENDVYHYSWHDSNSCNCGILARTIMNGAEPIEEGGLWDNIKLDGSFIGGSVRGFSGAVEKSITRCKQTGVPYPRVIKALLDYNFTIDEMKALEFFAPHTEGKPYFFSDDKMRVEKVIGSRLDLKNMVRSHKEHLIMYLKAWVEAIEEKEIIPSTEKETISQLETEVV